MGHLAITEWGKFGSYVITKSYYVMLSYYGVYKG